MRSSHSLAIISFLIFFPLITPALNKEKKLKYDYLLLTKDYGILNESDFINLTKKIIYPTSKERIPSGIYWQCFPNKNISLILEDFGYSGEELYWKENFSLLTFKIKTSENTSEEYILSHPYGMSENMEILLRWKKLIKNQEYICISGSHFTKNKEIKKGKNITTNLWIFEELKTKKGCNSYFYNQCKFHG